MDTKFWGPSGWKLLHYMTESFPDRPSETQKANMITFFNVLGEVLPCKYCRISFKEYIALKPVEKAVVSKEKLCRWMYDIHNMVSAKLRKQGLHHEKDPSYKLVRRRFKENLKDPGFRAGNEGINFISSVAFNYPVKQKCERCKKLYYELFFITLPKVIPDLKFSEVLSNQMTEQPIQHILQCRSVMKKWMYDLICKYNSKKSQSYKGYCKKIEYYRASGCEKKNHKGNTCRKKMKKRSRKKGNRKKRSKTIKKS